MEVHFLYLFIYLPFFFHLNLINFLSTFRLHGNLICTNSNTPNILPFCRSGSGQEDNFEISTNSPFTCQNQSCPTDNFYEYDPSSPTCFCAVPLLIGYRLKSPSFSYFNPYEPPFERYVTKTLNLELYQLYIDSIFWEGLRLRMYIKLFPTYETHQFNMSEVRRIRDIFASWIFPGSDFFGPYELLNFTLVGPYSESMYSILIYFLVK